MYRNVTPNLRKLPRVKMTPPKKLPLLSLKPQKKLDSPRLHPKENLRIRQYIISDPSTV